jgi:hypothetical protein
MMYVLDKPIRELILVEFLERSAEDYIALESAG